MTDVRDDYFEGGADEAESFVAAVSWILELPRDLGLAQDTYSSNGTADDVPPGWEGRLSQLPEWPGCELPSMPRKRLRFRRARVGIGMPTEATDRAFHDLRRFRGLPKITHRLGLWRLSRKGVKEWKTVCQMTRWYTDGESDAIIEAEGGSQTPLEHGFYELLEDLDLWLQAYGLISGDVEVGSIALHDLPAVVPWTIHYKEWPEAPEFTFTGMLPIHDRVPALLPRQGDQNAAKEAGVIMAVGQFPSFSAMTLLFQAQSAALAGRGRQAVIDAGTAVEAMVAVVIRRGLSARGRPEAEIDALLSESKWRNLYNRELLDVLGVPAGEAGAAHAKWWRVHYRQRNDAVHAAAVPGRDAASEMVSDTWDLFHWISENARANPDLADLGNAIAVHRK